jgi:hypothetical protein
LDTFPCPSCRVDCQSLHIDANFKLYTHNRDCRYDPVLWQPSSNFIPDAQVVEQRNMMYDVQRPDGKTGATCGGTWKAARDDSKLVTGQFYTARMLATCRHEMVVRGLNIIQEGERHAYHLILLLDILQTGVSVETVHLDIACMWTTWARRLLDSLATFPSEHMATFRRSYEQVQQLLQRGSFKVSEMHAKLHTLACQVLDGQHHNAVGAGEDGESTERVNSKYSTMTNTRNMGKAVSTLYLSEQGREWNRRKELELAHTLHERYGACRLTCSWWVPCVC